MKFPVYMIVLLFLCPVSGPAQPIDSVAGKPGRGFLPLVHAGHEQSYITFGGGMGNIKPIILEANIVPTYFLSSKKAHWALAVSPKVILRMMNEPSLPVRTPSYMPQIAFYHTIKSPLLLKKWCTQGFWHLKLVHHSNGQDGYFRDPHTGAVNYTTGDFFTNYAEWGLSYTGCRQPGGRQMIHNVRTWAEYHPDVFRSDALLDGYGFFRTYVSYGLHHPNTRSRMLARTKAEAKLGWLFGSMRETTNTAGARRIIFAATCTWYPRWLEQLAFFAQFYRGQDYYNIYFVHNLTLLRFGIMSETLNFSQLQHLLTTRE